MNKISYILILILVVLFSCRKVEPYDDIPAYQNLVPHPRLMLLEGEEEKIKTLIESDETWKKLHLVILNESDEIIRKPVLEREMIGRRLLSTSRELLLRVFYLSYSYRMTEDKRFLKKAEKEILAVCEFSDWNPSHFLDVAEMTMGVAIGYDWLYNEFSDETKERILYAIINKGIHPSNNWEYNWFLYSENNWNPVCNASMLFGALAIQEDRVTMAQEIYSRARKSINLAMGAYRPDGGYPEGYGYWRYGTTFNVLYLNAVETNFYIHENNSGYIALKESGKFLNHMVAPSGYSFNWGDNHATTRLNPAMFWLSEKTQDPSILWSEKRILDTDDYAKFKSIRTLPAILIWAKDIAIDGISPPEEKFWVGQGSNPTALMRTSWTDKDAIFMGFKSGSASVNHGHMDVGSFIMEADGVRWASDLGQQNYESLESKGLSIFGKAQNAQRWTIFTMNTYSHNVLIIDDQQQITAGRAKMDKYSDEESFMYSISDVSEVYQDQLKKAVRGVGIIESKYTVIRDEIETLDKPTKIRWNMLTGADVELTEKGAKLTRAGKTLYLKIQGPDNINMKIWSTDPTNDYDQENPNTRIVGFECELPANTTQSFEVLLVPQSVESEAHFLNNTLNDW